MRKALLLGVLAVGLLTAACGEGSPEGEEGLSSETVRGFIVAVDAKSLVELESLVVRADNGGTWEFRAGDFRGKTPSHLRLHMVQGLPITVLFHSEGDALLIDDIID